MLALGWAVWGGLHSVLIDPRREVVFCRRFPRLCPYFRLIYNALAVLTLIPLPLAGRALAGAPLFSWSGPLLPVRVVLLGAVVYLAWGGARQYDLGWVAGLAQLRPGGAGARPPRATDLRTSGVLARVRHPWYGSALLLLWTHAGAYDAAGLVTSLTLSAYVVIGARLEERRLLRAHGRIYAEYRSRTAMFFPWP